MKSLQVQMEDAIASVWNAIQSAELTDIPALAAYLASNLIDGHRDSLAAVRRLGEANIEMAAALDEWRAAIIEVNLATTRSEHARD